MKRKIGISMLAMLAAVFFAMAVHAALEKGSMNLAPGDEVYACGCGADCNCRTLSRNPGQCMCGKDLVQAKVMKVEGTMAMLDVNGKEETFPTVGKFACACGATCNCDTISQSAGSKCTCGTPMAPVQ